MDTTTQTELDAAVLRRLLQHLDENKDVQNIELMILAKFCRNCLSKWYVAAAAERGLEMDIEEAPRANLRHDIRSMEARPPAAGYRGATSTLQGGE